MVLVKPATVVQWHRQGFRLYWRWRSRSGRPSIDREVRDLIRQMNKANPLWGAPRIHGELLKLGIEVSQATVGKYMVRRIGTPSPTWRTFLRNEAIGIAAIDMFVAVSASFQLLHVMIAVTHSRREIVRFDVTRHPTAAWLSQQVIEAFPWDTAVASQNLIRSSPFCGSATDDRNMHLRGQISQSLWRRRTLQTRIPRFTARFISQKSDSVRRRKCARLRGLRRLWIRKRTSLVISGSGPGDQVRLRQEFLYTQDSAPSS